MRGVGGEGGARGGRDPNAGGRGDVDRGRRGDGGLGARSLDLKSLNPSTPGWGALGPRGPMGRWGTDPSFTKAMKEYQDRSLGVRALDFIGGPFFDAMKPQPLSPKTYAGGAYHTATNVPGAIGSVLGAATGIPGAGTLLGLLGSQIPGGYAFHGGNPALAGFHTGTGAPGAAPGVQGGNGNAWAQMAQNGLMQPTPLRRVGLMR